jgi:hypothetical protein
LSVPLTVDEQQPGSSASLLAIAEELLSNQLRKLLLDG